MTKTLPLRVMSYTQTRGLKTVGLPGLSDLSPIITFESPEGSWKLQLPRELFNFPVDCPVMAAVTLMAVQVVEETEPAPKSGLILPGRAN
jgi:hypothetical protein